jgi:hypothetical protein
MKPHKFIGIAALAVLCYFLGFKYSELDYRYQKAIFEQKADSLQTVINLYRQNEIQYE